jgi:hypothetical protein
MSKRWLSPWKDSLDKPAIYHCISRVVGRLFKVPRQYAYYEPVPTYPVFFLGIHGGRGLKNAI